MTRWNGGVKGVRNNASGSSGGNMATGIWRMEEASLYTKESKWPIAPYTIEYLVVAGGAGGGGVNNVASGGGGGGGVLTGTAYMLSGASYSITVGGGGSLGYGSGNGSLGGQGSNGGDSSLAIFGSTLTSIGGGGGGVRYDYFGTQARSGGSGGGSGGGGQVTPHTSEPQEAEVVVEQQAKTLKVHIMVVMVVTV
jgi:hypothetical protein